MNAVEWEILGILSSLELEGKFQFWPESQNLGIVEKKSTNKCFSFYSNS